MVSGEKLLTLRNFLPIMTFYIQGNGKRKISFEDIFKKNGIEMRRAEPLDRMIGSEIYSPAGDLDYDYERFTVMRIVGSPHVSRKQMRDMGLDSVDDKVLMVNTDRLTLGTPVPFLSYFSFEPDIKRLNLLSDIGAELHRSPGVSDVVVAYQMGKKEFYLKP